MAAACPANGCSNCRNPCRKSAGSFVNFHRAAGGFCLLKNPESSSATTPAQRERTHLARQLNAGHGVVGRVFLKMQPIFRSVPHLNPLVDVAHAEPVGFQIGLGHRAFETLVDRSNVAVAVVGDHQREKPVVEPARDPDIHAAVVHPVQNAVFHQRLEQHLRNADAVAVDPDIVIEQHAVAQQKVLQRDVIFQHIQLALERNLNLRRRNVVPQEHAQRRDRPCDLRFVVQRRQVVHRVQRVAQEVRIDLRLHHPQLQFLFPVRIFQLFADRFLHLVHQIVVTLVQDPDVVVGNRMRGRNVRHLLRTHMIGQVQNGAGNAPGEYDAKDSAGQQHQHQHRAEQRIYMARALHPLRRRDQRHQLHPRLHRRRFLRIIAPVPPAHRSGGVGLVRLADAVGVGRVQNPLVAIQQQKQRVGRQLRKIHIFAEPRRVQLNQQHAKRHVLHGRVDHRHVLQTPRHIQRPRRVAQKPLTDVRFRARRLVPRLIGHERVGIHPRLPVERRRIHIDHGQLFVQLKRSIHKKIPMIPLGNGADGNADVVAD